MRAVWLLILISSLLAVKAETFASCNRLNFQWNPITANYSEGDPLDGILSVTGEAMTTERYGNFNLVCNNNTRIVNPSISNISIPPNVETSVNFSLQQLNDAQPSNCYLQYCFTGSVEENCTIVQCNITLPQLPVVNWDNREMETPIPQWINPNTSSHFEPVYFQWIPINAESGNLIITYYIERENKSYQYEVSCDGLTIRNYTFVFVHVPLVDGIAMASYRIMNVSLSVIRTEGEFQYNCQLTVCTERERSDDCQETDRFNVTIPDLDVINKKIAARPNVLYYYWQKPNSAVELKASGDQMNCDNIKFYWMMDNNIQGQLIIQYNITSTMQLLQGRFSMSCDAQVRQAEIPYVSLQRNFGTITMIFTLEYFHNDTFCSMDLCLYEFSREGKCNWQEAYCSPIFLFKDWVEEELMNKNSIMLREAEQCRMNTWLWVVHSIEEGEAHFVLGDDILDAAMYGGRISLSCGNLTVTSLNPLSIQYVLGNADVASFVVQNMRYPSGTQECVLDVCTQGYIECNLIYSCYIAIPLHQGAFELSSQLNELETCPQFIWKWKQTSNGGVLSIKIRQEDRGVISIHCTGIIVDGYNEVSNTHTGTFYLIESLHSQSPPSCNVHFCVRQYQYIGCKKSFDCVLTIPSNGMLSRAARSLLPRATQSYEEPSKQLLEICEQESDSVVLLCADRMWDIFYTTGYAIGEVSLRINLQRNDKVDEFLKVSVHCPELNLKGSTEHRLVIPKTLKETIVEFNISLPQSSNEEPQTHQCILQTQRRPVSHNEQANDTMCPSTTSCSISVKTVLGRILPKCNATEGRKSIHHIDIVRNQAKVEVTVSASPNNVYTVDPYCNKNNPLGHNTSEELWSNVFPSTTTGEGQVTIAISFHPDCDNKTIASHFVDKRLEDCHMDLYWYCQGGEQVIQSIKNLQFSDEPMYCEPQSIVKTSLLSVQKSFGVRSEPVAILLAILIGVVGLYGLLIPVCFVVAYCRCRNNSYHEYECEDEDGVDDDDDILSYETNSDIRLESSVQSDRALLI